MRQFQTVILHKYIYLGGGQNFERRNVEWLTFRNFKIANIKITKDELFDGFIIEFIFSFFRNYLNTQNIEKFFELYNIDFPNGKIKKNI